MITHHHSLDNNFIFAQCLLCRNCVICNDGFKETDITLHRFSCRWRSSIPIAYSMLLARMSSVLWCPCFLLMCSSLALQFISEIFSHISDVPQMKLTSEKQASETLCVFVCKSHVRKNKVHIKHNILHIYIWIVISNWHISQQSGLERRDAS